MCCFLPQISEAVLGSGEHLSRKFRVQNQSPLMYEWYQEQYVGAAHGLAGIYYFLMQVRQAVLGSFCSYFMGQCFVLFNFAQYPLIYLIFCLYANRGACLPMCAASRRASSFLAAVKMFLKGQMPENMDLHRIVLFFYEL